MTSPWLSASDLSKLRFAPSPLIELVESLWLLAVGRGRPPLSDWHRRARGRVSAADLALLSAVIPGQPMIADFLVTEQATDIEQQLAGLAASAPAVMQADLAEVWAGLVPPPILRELTPSRVADALHAYWTAVIEPGWPLIRAVLQDDIAYRTHRFTAGGTAAVFADLHPALATDAPALPESAQAGIRLVPSVFAWPALLVAPGRAGPVSLIYGARRAETLWGADGDPGDDAVRALLGRTRAAVLSRLVLPITTSELAEQLGQSPATVSHHLGVLRQAGLATAWRSGRFVRYQRTPLGSSVLVAGGTLPGPG